MPAATIAPTSTAARPAATLPLTATDPTFALLLPEVTAFLPAATASSLQFEVFGPGLPWPDEAQCGGHEGAADELHRPTP
jgi:hypothetical protein